MTHHHAIASRSAAALAVLALAGCQRRPEAPPAGAPAPPPRTKAAAGAPAVPKDLIVFCRGERLFTIALDGSGERALETGDAICAAPSWTPTQPRRVLYVSSAPASAGSGSGLEPLQCEIRESDLVEGRSKVVVPAWPGPAGSEVSFWDLGRPQVCPATGRIAFVRTGGPQARPVVCVLPARGAKPKEVLKGADFDVVAAKGGDVAWVVTSTPEEPVRYGLRRAPLKPGAAGAELLPPSSVYLSHPVCSPDGQQVVYVEGDEPFLGDRLQIMGASGGPETLYVTEGPSLDWPTWSPDGKWIAFVRGSPATGSDICLLNVTQPEAEPTVLTEGSQPAWYR